MHHRTPVATHRHRAAARQERSLIPVKFVGSYPAVDFRLAPVRPEICFLGRSNVGKSSLINAFAGQKTLARTSRTPGKTRMCNVFDVDGRFYLVDLPGYGYSRVGMAERQGMQALVQRYLTERQTLRGAVWLLDMRRDPSAEDHAVGELLAARGVPVLVAITKADKLARSHRQERLRTIGGAVGMPEDQCVLTSARTQSGIDDLRDSVFAFVGQGAAGSAEQAPGEQP
ncbi:MAG: ribosome biogenesis GTP-binding protein YihA/YsxC [Gemmatimonadota bacterium]|nr:ribosome biogenesis GTP-binding protein YihA/YsxC [Gemmatimonadota bacterium]MDH3366961.1 ribosome biogenesis GTP-binding protein YihA/YsxC [Gemmatimonadota bacterium]MDH3478111.1 ribosome biogenesis GTP-binding protein YihA/YsxC [Gemmatimonadota bacterium]MDH3569534.1 ribosome biogenesis GTP-binding protein YihA/YsxC [Gemmatimonadota bacterium]MDH5550307.1 ribosome biogenesis GTP-binding protein YihA/YsxC [Gemmatimonadota bacterium]